jgi:hypothetical protein
MDAELDLLVVGGCAHVGLPLDLSFADSGYWAGIYDHDAEKTTLDGREVVDIWASPGRAIRR